MIDDRHTVDFEHLSSHSKPEESLGFLLWHASTYWRSSIEKTLKLFNLTHPQFVVLAATGWLTQKGEHASQAIIGRTAGLDPNTTSQILRSLEAKLLINRARSIDERSKTPYLTSEGAEILKKALPAVEKTDSAFFAILTRTEQQKLLTIFQKLLKT